MTWRCLGLSLTYPRDKPNQADLSKGSGFQMAESLLLTDAAVAGRGLFGLTPGPGPRLSSSAGLSADLSSTVRVPAVTFRVLLRSDEYVRARRQATDSAQVPAAARRPTASRPGRGRGPGVPSPV